MAAEKEFSSVPLAKASISNIIKVAGIPRGSFYQYFTNIDDLYFYLLDQKTKERKQSIIFLLEKHDGDLLEAVIEFYRSFLVQMPDEEEHNFLKNAVLNVTHKLENTFTNIFDANQGNEFFDEIIVMIDKKRLNIRDDKEVFHIMQIVTAVAFRNFVEKFTKNLTDDEAIHNFTIEMNLLKHGLYRRE